MRLILVRSAKTASPSISEATLSKFGYRSPQIANATIASHSDGWNTRAFYDLSTKYEASEILLFINDTHTNVICLRAGLQELEAHFKPSLLESTKVDKYVFAEHPFTSSKTPPPVMMCTAASAKKLFSNILVEFSKPYITSCDIAHQLAAQEPTSTVHTDPGHWFALFTDNSFRKFHNLFIHDDPLMPVGIRAVHYRFESTDSPSWKTTRPVFLIRENTAEISSLLKDLGHGDLKYKDTSYGWILDKLGSIGAIIWRK